jgi:hypothetical protein|eukprot:SAG25_NODE_1475_length_2947_cov_2.597612_5_plen_72_part_00
MFLRGHLVFIVHVHVLNPAGTAAASDMVRLVTLVLKYLMVSQAGSHRVAASDYMVCHLCHCKMRCNTPSTI